MRSSFLLLIVAVLSTLCLSQARHDHLKTLSKEAFGNPSCKRCIRGGAIRAAPSKKSKFDAKKKADLSESKRGRVNFAKAPSALIRVRDAFLSVKPVTRAFISATLVTAAVHMTGLPAPRLFALNIRRLHELWRVFTAATYLGGPSLSLANNVYFLVNYGQLLESVHGTADFAFFLLTQIGMLSIFSLLLQFPFTAQSMIAAIIYCCSRIHAMDTM